MSAIILLPVIIPAVAAAWPVVATAAAAAAAAMGYASIRSSSEVKGGVEVEIPVENSEAVTGDMALGEELVFAKDDVRVIFFRNVEGRVAVKVCGKGKSEDELGAIGREVSRKLVQQYAYHRVVSELKQRNLSVVQEDVEEDGTVRLQVRTYQG
ncbi:DUF1257 domain-containing protein [Planctomycetota bacterium]